MKLKQDGHLFAKMLFLDAEIERLKSTFVENQNSNHYYTALLNIREAQNCGQIPTDEEYVSISPFRSYNSPELGFYNANKCLEIANMVK